MGLWVGVGVGDRLGGGDDGVFVWALLVVVAKGGLLTGSGRVGSVFGGLRDAGRGKKEKESGFGDCGGSWQFV